MPEQLQQEQTKETNKFLKVKEAVDLRLEQLVENYGSPETNKAIQDYLDQFTKFHNYSASNYFLIEEQAFQRFGHESRISYLRSFDDWGKIANEKGEYVKINKGEVGYNIVIPIPKRQYEMDADGKEILDAEGKKIPLLDKDGKQVWKTTFGVGSVFDISQTNAFEIGAVKKLPYRENGSNITEEFVQDMAEQIRKAYDLKIDFKYLKDENLGGIYNSADDTIIINNNQKRNPSAQLSSLFHELGHAQMHNLKAMEEHKNTTGQELSKGQKEVQAEAFGYIFAKEFGINNKSELYLKGWKDKLTANDLRELFTNVKKAANRTVYKLNIAQQYEIVHEDLPEVKLQGYEHSNIRHKIANLAIDKDVRQTLHEKNDRIKREQDLDEKQKLFKNLETEIKGYNSNKTKQSLTPEEKQARAERRDKLASEGNVIINVKYEDKNEARKLGAQWDMEGKTFYVPKGIDASKFQKFMGNQNDSTAEAKENNTERKGYTKSWAKK